MASAPPGWAVKDGSAYAAGWRCCARCEDWRHSDRLYLERYLARHAYLSIAIEELLLIKDRGGRLRCPVCGLLCRCGPMPQTRLRKEGNGFRTCQPVRV